MILIVLLLCMMHLVWNNSKRQKEQKRTTKGVGLVNTQTRAKMVALVILWIKLPPSSLYLFISFFLMDGVYLLFCWMVRGQCWGVSKSLSSAGVPWSSFTSTKTESTTWTSINHHDMRGKTRRKKSQMLVAILTKLILVRAIWKKKVFSLLWLRAGDTVIVHIYIYRHTTTKKHIVPGFGWTWNLDKLML